MTEALDALNARIAELDARDDQIVALVSDLRVQVAALQDQLANTPDLSAELQAAADKLGLTVAKFDSVLAPTPAPPLPGRRASSAARSTICIPSRWRWIRAAG